MRALKPSLAALAACGLAGCVGARPVPGTPEFTASRVSRAYDCGLGVDRGRIVAGLPKEDRARFIAANASYAVKSYNAPRRCEAGERAELQHELRARAGR